MNRLDLSAYRRGRLISVKSARQIERDAQSWPALIVGSLVFAALLSMAAVAIAVMG